MFKLLFEGAFMDDPIITALLFMGIDYNDIHFNLKPR